MQYGYRIIDDLISGLSAFIAKSGYKSLKEMSGCALKNICTADDIDRSTIVYPVFDREKCIGCGRCSISCYDGGHQAIRFTQERRPQLEPSKCVGCHLCRLVCPAGAIGKSKRVKKRFLTV